MLQFNLTDSPRVITYVEKGETKVFPEGTKIPAKEPEYKQRVYTFDAPVYRPRVAYCSVTQTFYTLTICI